MRPRPPLLAACALLAAWVLLPAPSHARPEAAPPPPAEDDTLEIAMLVAAGALTATCAGLWIATEVEAADLAGEVPDPSNAERLAQLSARRPLLVGGTLVGVGLTTLAVFLLVEEEPSVVPTAAAAADGGFVGLRGRF